MTPLALYIHWPFCKSKCPYCDFNSHVREHVDMAAWHKTMLAELDYTASLIGEHKLVSIFFGGGTPSLMSPDTVAALIERAKVLWPSTAPIEITLEANPTSVEAGKFRAFRDAGINRVSLGIQSLKPESLTFLGREHSASEALAAIELAATIFPRYSFDLIYALPHQSVKEWESELSDALKLAGDHLSLYQLTIEENTAFHHAYHHKGAFSLPDEELGASLYEATQAIMNDAELRAYEISNHARAGYESRHNLAYWRGEVYAGVGPGAHGRLLIDGAWHATRTLKSPERWLENVQLHGHGLDENIILKTSERGQEYLMMALRLSEGVDLRRFELASLINHERMALYDSMGLLTRNAHHLTATDQGRLVLNRLVSELLV